METDNRTEKEKFMALTGTAKGFVGVGWIILVGSLFLAIMGIGEIIESYSPDSEALLSLAVGIPGFLAGAIFIGIGEIIKCFVGVYDNTWKVAHSLDEQNDLLEELAIRDKE